MAKLAYKAFEKGLICRGYQFDPKGINRTEAANCARNGFHCAANPFDCLSYYSDVRKAEFAIVYAGGDIDEDANDSKIACTEMLIVRRMDAAEFMIFCARYYANHLDEEYRHVEHERGVAKRSTGYTIVIGRDPLAKGKIGDTLLCIRQPSRKATPTAIAAMTIDGETFFPDTWYDAEGKEREDD